MRAAGLRYAYVTSVPGTRAEVERVFAAPAFRLVQSSTVVAAELIGVRRHLFRRGNPAVASSINRYLFILTGS
jgi:hypothetical protein